MSLADYAVSEIPNNELVRSLVGTSRTDDLTDEDLLLSIVIVCRKYIVGLLDWSNGGIHYTLFRMGSAGG